MATLKDILETENARADGQQRKVIHLFTEGAFLRAYEWSAWLCSRYIHEFRATKRFYKGEGRDVVFVGFPLSSLDKWVPVECDVEVVDEKHRFVVLPIDDASEMATWFEEWRSALPLSEPSKTQARPAKPGDGTPMTTSPTDVTRQIVSFPLESKTPIECMLFLADLKKQLSETE